VGELVELQAGEWALWRTVAVRAAGFPADGLAVFGDEEDAGLAGLAGDERFREALTWQNQDALGNALDRLSAAASGSTRRRRLETVASYWQRYCAKNDTIGFFGPLGWGQLADDGPAAVAEPGAELLAARMTRFEVWAIDALAAVLADDPGVRRWIPPRRHPARLPAGLDAAEEQVYWRCDGRPAFEAGPVELVAKLADRGLLVWAFRVPLGPHPERELRAQLEAIGDPAVQARCLEALDRLEAARAAVAAAAGNTAALGRALDELGQVFESLTGVAPRRRAGEMYAGRSVCYEDCRRNLTLRLGPDVVAELARVLVPVLAGARWYCGEVAEVGRAVIAAAVAEARTGRGTGRIPLADVWRRVIPQLMPAPARRELPAAVAGAEAAGTELQRRWTQLLAGDLDTLAERARAVFAGARPSWRRARFHGPDVQIAATSADAINRGEFTVVVGDFHPGSAPIGQSVFLEGHPEPDEVRRFFARYVPEPRLVWVLPRNVGRAGGRFFPGYPTAADYCLLTTEETCMPAGYRSVALAELWVEQGADGPVIVTGEGKPIAPLQDAFEHHLFIAGIRSYNPFAPAPHAPRITVGRSVLRREMWTLNGTDIGWAHRKQQTHTEARQWARQLGMPRRVFALASGEAKPIYVDFNSRALVSILGRQIRAAGQAPVRFSEMLPDPGHLWLTDAQGNRYTSELRLTAVDLRHS
jgi:Lantibiotic dehydratase, N terminus